MAGTVNRLGRWSTGGQTAAGATAFRALIPPYPGPPGSSPLLVNPGSADKTFGKATTYLSNLIYKVAANAHTLTIMRPLNWTTFAAAVAKNATAFSLAVDPGVFSTNYNFPLPAGQTAPCLAADVTIASTHVVAYQMDDGVWQVDTIASGTFGGGNLVLTTGTPNRNGATIAKGRILYFFGAATSVDPATGLAHPSLLTDTTTNIRIESYLDTSGDGLWGALHPGDPLVINSDNATSQGRLSLASGFYGQF